MKKIMNFMVSRLFVLGVSILLQFCLLMFILYAVSASIFEVYFFFYFLSFIFTIYVINKKDNPSYTIAWVIIILTLPLFGGVFYLLFGGKKIPKALQKHAMRFNEERMPLLVQNELILDEIKSLDKDVYKQVFYIWNNVYYPIYKNTETEYYPIGEQMFSKLLEELQKAKKFIFLEYFIIEEGMMWNSIHKILLDKVKEGVEVRVLYDDAGCVQTLPRNYDKILNAEGIKCKVFNPLKAKLAIQMNNRDHRKIVVIDGIVGFTGGINLADEYINAKQRFGHWKDVGMYCKGDAVWSFTMMFLQFWNFNSKSPDDYRQFRISDDMRKEFKTDGYIQPYSDSPTDDEPVGETAHTNMINLAKEYVYITTPYLIIGYEMIRALSIAAKNGVDVRITVPHKPDKWYVHMVTRSHYEELTKNGVKIYEYLPGFVHGKTLVADDTTAIVGTTNMDYRSYYMHYECGAILYKNSVIATLKEDYFNTLKQCKQITYQDCLDINIVIKFARAIMNLFSPLM